MTKTVTLTHEQWNLLLDYADYGADEKEAWLESGPLEAEDQGHEEQEIAEARDAIRALMEALRA